MAKATKLKSGSFRCQACITIDGKRIRKSFTVNPADCLGNSYRERSSMAKRLAEKMADEWVITAEHAAHQITVKQAMESYIADRSNILSASTLADYKRMPHHFENILEMDIRNVTSKVLQSEINSMSLDLNERTVKNRIFFLIACLNYNGLERKFNLRFRPSAKKILNPPEKEEMHRILAFADGEMKLIIILAAFYTLRRGEIAGLCGEDLFPELGQIYVHSSRVKDSEHNWIRRDLPKNINSVRTIRIAPEIMQLFPKVESNEFIFSLNPDQISKRFERIRKKTLVHCRFHDLRKYAASTRSEVMPSKYVEADGGWRKDSGVLKTIYDKPFQKSRNDYSKKYNDLILTEYGSELFKNAT